MSKLNNTNSSSWWIYHKLNEMDRKLLPSRMSSSSSSSKNLHLRRQPRIAIFGSVDFYNREESPTICDLIGTKLAQAYPNCCLLTGANAITQQRLSYSFYKEWNNDNNKLKESSSTQNDDDDHEGDEQNNNNDNPFDSNDYCKIFHLSPIGYKCNWEFGIHLTESGRDMEERRYLLSNLSDICLVIEGGPGTVDEISKAIDAKKPVIPIRRTGGASAGMFHAPTSITELLSTKYYNESTQTTLDKHWKLLGNDQTGGGGTTTTLEDSAQAVIDIISTILMIEQQQQQQSQSQTVSK